MSTFDNNSIDNKSQAKIKFSIEVLNYFETIRTKENSKWIDKYFKILSDPININTLKYHFHHIRPCFTFKDTNHKIRKETQKLGDAFNGNRIKLSIYNHLFAHYYLWKIFNNRDSKIAFQHMCNQEKYIENITEKELKIIATLREECFKENLTKTEIREHQKVSYKKYQNSAKGKTYIKNYQNKNHKALTEYQKDYYVKNKEIIKENRKKHYKENSTKIYERKKNYRKNNPIKIREQNRKYNNQKCIDPIRGDICTLSALRNRKGKYKEKYINISPTDCIIKQ